MWMLAGEEERVVRPSYRVERAARGWYIFAVGEGGVPLYKLTRGPFKTKEEADAAFREIHGWPTRRFSKYVYRTGLGS